VQISGRLVRVGVNQRSSEKRVDVRFQQLMSKYFEANYNESPYTT
jgi:hypothetical protein